MTIISEYVHASLVCFEEVVCPCAALPFELRHEQHLQIEGMLV